MTPVVLYQYFVRFAIFLDGIFLIWIAVFSLLTWLLHYEPAKINDMPTSGREHIALITCIAALGVFAMVFAVNMVFAKSTTAWMAIKGCAIALGVLIQPALVWITIGELRRAVRLRRQPLRQQTNE